MKNQDINQSVVEIEQMDPDFGRLVGVGEGFGVITDDEYAQLEADLAHS